MDDFRASSGLLISITTSVIEWRKNARPKCEEAQCVQPAKKRYSGHKSTEILLAKGREKKIFFYFFYVEESKKTEWMQRWNCDEQLIPFSLPNKQTEVVNSNARVSTQII